MSYVGALLLMHISDTERAFWVLLQMIDRHLGCYFEERMSGILRDRVVFSRILARCNEPLAKHLESNNIDCLLFLTPWIMCMFTGLSSWQSVLRIWDLFFVEGKSKKKKKKKKKKNRRRASDRQHEQTTNKKAHITDVSAIYRTAVAILNSCAEELLEMEGMDKLLPYLLNLPVSVIQADRLFSFVEKLDIAALLKEEIDKYGTNGRGRERERERERERDGGKRI
jgi:hypothetical protein